MAQNLLRALRHRSTPTLLPSNDQQAHTTPPIRFEIFVPSIVVTVPFEEGGAHYCAFAGSPFPPSRARIAAATAAAAAGNFRDAQASQSFSGIDANSVLASATFSRRGGGASSSQNNDGSAAAFDVPLPDFAALEETISKLRRQGETPTFKRPETAMEQQAVVMPKRKTMVEPSTTVEDEHDAPKGLPSGAKKTSRPRPPRSSFPLTSPPSSPFEDEEWETAVPTANEEVVQVTEEAILHAMHAAQNPPERKQSLLRGFTIRWKKDQQQQYQQQQLQRPRASISYESVLHARAAAIDPEDYVYDEAGAPSPSRSTWQRTPSPVLEPPRKTKRNSLNWIFPSKKQKQPKRTSLPPQPVVERASHPMDVQWPESVPAHEAEYKLPDCFPEIEEGSAENATELVKDKPLPPIPMSQSQSSGWEQGYELVEMQIHNTPVVGAILQSTSSVTAPPQEPQQTVAPDVAPNSVPSDQQGEGKDRKPKRKFSLKRLREKFLSPSSTPAPPVPALPTTTADAPKLPPVPILVVTAPVVLPSTDTNASFVNTSTNDVQEPEELPVSPRVTMESVASIPVVHASLDEDSNLSTSSEDSTSSGSSAMSSAVSTPDSTPPDTPDSATAEGTIFAAQQQQKQATKAIEVMVAKVNEVVAAPIGIPRSHGMRMKLDSLHFEELRIEVGNVA